jgi:hypothetical protein
MKNPLKTLLIKIINYAYPNEKARANAMLHSFEKKYGEEQAKFRREIKLALGTSVTYAAKRHSDIQIIALVRETSDELCEMKKQLGITAKQLNVAPEDVYEEAKSILDLEKDISELNSLAQVATEKKKTLIEEQKIYQKERITKAREICEKEIAEAQAVLEKLNTEHVQAAEEVAKVEQTIANKEEK